MVKIRYFAVDDQHMAERGSVFLPMWRKLCAEPHDWLYQYDKWPTKAPNDQIDEAQTARNRRFWLNDR